MGREEDERWRVGVVSLDTERRGRRLEVVLLERLVAMAGRPIDEACILDLLEVCAHAMHDFEVNEVPDETERFSLEKCRDLCRGPVFEVGREVGVVIRPRAV
jgi:hypothetical protein